MPTGSTHQPAHSFDFDSLALCLHSGRGHAHVHPWAFMGVRGVPNPEPLKEIVQSLFIFLPVAEFGLWHETENPGMPIARHTVGGVACSSASTSPDACVCVVGGEGSRVCW